MITIKCIKEWGRLKKGEIVEVGNDHGLYLVNNGSAEFISGGVTKKSNNKKEKEYKLLRKYGLNELSLSYGRVDILKILRQIEEINFLKKQGTKKINDVSLGNGEVEK